ncbi:YfhO family protein [bacterium]|nr:YfhO family protein [bacterium]
MKKLVYISILVAIVIVFFGGFIFSDKMIFGTDYVDIGHFTVKYFHDYFHEFGSYPFWDSHLHGGLPFVEAMHGAIFFPLAIPLRILLPTHRAWGFGYVLYMLIAGFSMFLLLKFYKLKDGASFLGSLVFMLSPVLISFIYAGHDGRMSVIAILPFMVWLLERAMAKRKVIDFLWFAFGYAFYVLTVHLQMVYFASWLLGSLFVFRLIRGYVLKKYNFGGGAKITALFAGALVLAIGMTTFQIYPPYDYLGKYSVRTEKTGDSQGINFSNSWRMNLEDLVSSTYPDFVGINLQAKQTYWGRNTFRINSHYLGILSIILAIAALFALKKALLKFLAGFSLFAITYALGTQTPLFYIYYYLIPGVKKFRGPEMLFFTVAFSVAVGMAFAVDAILRAKSDERHKSSKNKSHDKRNESEAKKLARWILWTALGFTGMLIILSFIGKPLASWWLNNMPNYANANIQAKLAALGRNFPIFLKSSWLALVLAWLGIGVLYWRSKSSKLANYAVIIVLGIVLIVDLWRMSKPFVITDDINRYFPKTDLIETLQQIQQTEGPFRTLALPQTVSYTYLGTFGFDAVTFSELHGNQLKWYDEFTGRHRPKEQNIQKYYPEFWDILNIEYVLAPQQLNNIPFLSPVKQTSRGVLYRNLSAFPRARAFYRWETSSHSAALEKLKDRAFTMDSVSNYRTTLLVEDAPKISMPQIPDSLINGYSRGEIAENKDDDFYVKIDMAYDGLLFVSQNWYPEWSAEENGKQLPIIRADYSFIAVPLNAGEHKVHFAYKASLFKKSLNISLACMFAGLVLLIAVLFLNKAPKEK